MEVYSGGQRIAAAGAPGSLSPAEAARRLQDLSFGILMYLIDPTGAGSPTVVCGFSAL
jgi:hypothetical protein